MDIRALFQLSYGVFVLSTKSGEKVNGCITNTFIQVAENPSRVAFAVLNTNYTCELIKESGVFAASILDNSVQFETIKHFGMQSGRNVDKYAGMDLPKDQNGCPYLNESACAVISGKVIDSVVMDTHTLFIAEVLDMELLSDKGPLTYADYHARVKPQPKKEEKDKKIVGWRCTICQYEYEGSELPEDYLCPLCGHGKEDFEPIYE